jgi:lipopolysaccharide transport system permease protein
VRLDQSQLVSAAVDATIATGCYVLAYRLRLPGPSVSQVLPISKSTIGFMVSGQILGFMLAGVYSARPIVDKIGRFAIGALGGTALGVLAIFLTVGFTGFARSVFVIDLFLLWVLTISWRALRAFWTLERMPSATAQSGPRLIDRAVEGQSLVPTLVALLSYRELIRNLVFKDLKLKYRGSVLGFVWSMLNPLALVAVYTIAFKYIIGVRQAGFPFFILIGVIAWTFFANSAMMSTGAIIDSVSLVRAVRFPRAVLPIATVLFNLAQYVLMAIVFLPLMALFYRVPPLGSVFMFPVFLALQLAFTVGVALMLAAATVYFRDVRHFVDIAITMLFWTTPIIYPLTQVPEWLRVPILLSPMSPFIVAYHNIFYDGTAPDVSVWIVAIAYGLTTLAFGTVWFVSVEDHLSEQL